jgi:hypothetical protein
LGASALSVASYLGLEANGLPLKRSSDDDDNGLI